MLAFLPLFLVLLLPSPEAAAPKPDLLLENGVMYTEADAKPRKASIVAAEGRILFVGEPANARR